MNKRVLSIIGLIILGVLLFWGGSVYGQSRWTGTAWQPRWMMSNWNNQNAVPGMMGSGMMGSGMMGSGMMGSGMMGSGMMGSGMMGSGMMGSGMMDGGMTGGLGMMGTFNRSGLYTIEPLSLEDARTAVENYLASLDNSGLAGGEIMIFDNHAYAQIIEKETGRGAFEVLVDSSTRNIYPEPGPNMMWNTEYGMMGMMGGGMMNGSYGSGMMGNFGYPPDAEVNVTADKAPDIAQEYLDTYLPGKTADGTADAFPGYYTLHVLEDGEVVGMLSVNAYTGQVFLHHWHGDFIEMDGEDHSE